MEPATRSSRLTIHLAGGVLTTLSPLLPAAEYVLEYGVEATYEYNDNVNLNPQPIDAAGADITFPLSLKRRDELLALSLDAEASFFRYDVEEFDSNNQSLSASLERRLERGSIKAEAGFVRDTTRNSEFLDTGIVGPAAIRRELASFSGSATTLLTQRNGLVGGIDVSDVEYGDDRFQDYRFVSGYGGWLYQHSQRTGLRLQAYGNHFENDGAATSVSSEGLGVQTGVDIEFSERLSLSVLGGWIRVETDYDSAPGIAPLPGNEDDGVLLDANLRYRSERSQWELRASSQPRPSGIGVLLNSDRLDLSYRRSVSEHMNLTLSGNLGQQEAQDERINQDRDFARGSLKLDYRFAREWFFGARFVYSWQDAEIFAETVDGSAAYMTLRYQPLAKTWSR